MDNVLGILGGLAVLAAGFGAWRLGDFLARRLRKGAGEAVAGAALVLTGGLVLLVNHAPSRIPLSWILSPLIYLEFAYFVPTALLFFGLAARRVPAPGTLRFLAALSSIVALYAAGHVFLVFDARDLPMLSDIPWPGPVAPQTTSWSCGPAACVTLLKAHGIPSTEREMGELSLTMPRRGTTMPRFIRGLNLKIRKAGAPLVVRAEDHLSVSDLDTFPAPALLGLRLTLFTDHAVVLLGRDAGGHYLLADPIPPGKILPTDREEMNRRFTGEAIALVPR